MAFTQLGLCQRRGFIVCQGTLFKKRNLIQPTLTESPVRAQSCRDPTDSQDPALVLVGRVTGSGHVFSDGRDTVNIARDEMSRGPEAAVINRLRGEAGPRQPG